MELRMYVYRLYPSQEQQIRLLNQFSICKETYNILLSESKEHFFTSTYDFNSLILDIKATSPDRFSKIHSQVLQNVSDRLHKALNNFFNRIKLRKKGIKIKAGFPRFKSKVQSITYPQSGFRLLSNRRLKVSKVGSIPIILHRIPKGKIKTLTVKCNRVNQWFAVFSCEVDTPIIEHQSTESIGIDVGLENFLTDNIGKSIANPRFYIHAQKKLARLQRVHSRKVKGSKNREKARIKVAQQHLKVTNQRADFLHKLSRTLTVKYSIIAGEKLNINNMTQDRLAKYILDAGWGRFYRMLAYKAVTSGCQLLINPKTRGSSKRCSGCGTYIDMPLAMRTFKCPHCMLVLHRDHNAARNHMKDTVGLTEISTPVETAPPALRLARSCAVIEAGTTRDTS